MEEYSCVYFRMDSKWEPKKSYMIGLSLSLSVTLCFSRNKTHIFLLFCPLFVICLQSSLRSSLTRISPFLSLSLLILYWLSAVMSVSMNSISSQHISTLSLVTDCVSLNIAYFSFPSLPTLLHPLKKPLRTLL